MSEAPSPTPSPRYRSVHLPIREDLYLRLWKLVKDKYDIPTRKFHLVLNEALEKYLDSLDARA
jgi:hypothetical protein